MSSNTDPANPDDFVLLFAKHERELRAFVRSQVFSWYDVDEIVQEVALVAWQKFSQFTPGTSFKSWVCMIARFKILSFRRKMARDKLCFTENLIEVMSDEGLEELETRTHEFEALEHCLKTLPESQRALVTLAYSCDGSIKEEADKVGVKPGTLYMRLNRIRLALFSCIEQRMEEQPA